MYTHTLCVASDYTIYPFATTNPVDYANLRDVYMDAAFHPKLDRLDFKQEGWRLEHEVPTGKIITKKEKREWYIYLFWFFKIDVSTPIQFKGVVYNEMKGQTVSIKLR